MSGRMSRRSSKVSQDTLMCSQQSILSAMDRFVKAVNNMDSTVLVPSKLRDMDMASSAKTNRCPPIPPTLANTDLHSFYLMLNDVKKELLWGPASQHNTNLMAFNGRTSPRDLKHVRQPSDDSLGSLGSTVGSSSSDQDTDSEADSLMTDRDSIDEHTSHLAAAFRHHLQGLHTILHQLADSADYLSSRYQEDIDASSL
ncbi:mid1-interacting protein 1-like [Oppia nitens]|nr:mid1-interacting protein 1-like [Oppia nitens]